MKRNFWSLLCLFALAAQISFAAEPADKSKAKEAEDIETVEMFQAIEEGKIEVNFYPKDASQATVVFKNKTDTAINLDLPEAFGAIHIQGEVLGQMGGMGGMGGGMPGMGGMGGMGGMPGMM